MDKWDILRYAAWAVSVGLGGWLVWNMLSVKKTFSEELLMSSREGVDHLFDRDSDPGIQR